MSGLGIARKKLIENIILNHWNLKNPDNKQYTFTDMLFIIQEMLSEEGKPYFEQRNSHRGHTIFREFVSMIIHRQMANYDTMILLVGEKGVGKSSASIMLAKYYCKLLGIRFDPAKHIAYNNADLMRKINELPKFHPIIADESARFASSADWAKRENKELKKRLAEVRTKHLFFILNFPMKIEKVEKNYLDSFVNYFISLYARGRGSIFVKNRNPGCDTWSIKSFGKIGGYNEFNTPSQVEKVLKKHPNFWQTITFPKPSQELYNKYLKVRERNVYDEDSVISSISKEDIGRALLVLALKDMMTQEDEITVNSIILHINNKYDIKLQKNLVAEIIEDCNNMINKVRELNIQPKE